jgi:hypothetical protein
MHDESRLQYLGRFRLGDTLPLYVRVGHSIPLVAAVTDRHPVASIYKPDGSLLVRHKLPALAGAASGSAFFLPLRIGSTFNATGVYTVRFCWETTTDVMVGRVAVFAMLADRAADSVAGGPVIALKLGRRPQATFLIRQTSDDALAKGKNPR